MGTFGSFLKPIVAAVLLTTAGFHTSNAIAQESGRLDDLIVELKDANPAEAMRLEGEIRLEWERSGSASANFLLKRGRDAMERGDVEAAIGHYTALVDHAPEFAEGWVSRAGAYFHAGLLGPALQDLETALSLNPQHFEAIYGLGSIFESIDRPDDAYEAYLQVKSIHPHHADVTEALDRLEPLAKGQKL